MSKEEEKLKDDMMKQAEEMIKKGEVTQLKEGEWQETPLDNPDILIDQAKEDGYKIREGVNPKTFHYELLPPMDPRVRQAVPVFKDDQLSGTPQSSYQITQEDVGKPLSEIQNRIPNPLALNLYVLGYNSNRKLSLVNDAVKQNLKTYLSRFRKITDAVNIKNGYVINIGVEYKIITKSNFSQEQVLGLVNERVSEFFNIDNWQINQPIVLSDLGYEISLVDGVASVTDINIVNKYRTSQGYSGNGYDVEGALKNGILYPSLDPSIFEVKFPLKDIRGEVIGTNTNQGGY